MRIKFQILILALQFQTFNLFAQQIVLPGQVSIHNSKYRTGTIQYVKDAYVTASFAKSDNTDINGQFKLEFVGIDAGTSVKVKVEKAGLEVVNDYDLLNVIIGRKMPLLIYLAPKGQLEAAQLELYNISKKAIFAQKDSFVIKLHSREEISQATIKEIEERFGCKVSDRFEAEKILNQRIEELEKRLPEYAQILASQNLDYASDLFVSAFESYKKGEIEKAIQIIDSSNLEKAYNEAKKTIAKGLTTIETGVNLQVSGIQQILQIIANYELKAQSHLLLFNYQGAEREYEEIIKIWKSNAFDLRGLTEWYEKVALIYSEDGKYKKALDYQTNSLAIKEKIYNKDDLNLASSYNLIAVTYLSLGEYKKALDCLQKCLEIQKEKLDSTNTELEKTYSNIGAAFLYLGDIKQALKFQFLSIDISERQKTDEISLATAYNNIAPTLIRDGEYLKAIHYLRKALNILENSDNSKNSLLIRTYTNLGIANQLALNYSEAIEFHKKAIKLGEQLFGQLHPDLIPANLNLASTYMAMGEYQEADFYQKKAISIAEIVLDKNHPDWATIYNNVSVQYKTIGKFDEALDYQKKSLAIRENAFDSIHPDLASSYVTIAEIYQSLGDYKDALFFQKKGLEIREKIFDAMHPDLASSYNSLACTYEANCNYDEALKYHQKAISIREQTLDSFHPDLATSYDNIAVTYQSLKEPDTALYFQKKIVRNKKEDFTAKTS